MAYRDTVQAMYVAYYGRPADPAGIDYWSGLLDQVGGDPRAISQAFGDSQEFIDNYGGLSDEDLVKGLYLQLFDRSPDSEGLGFYVNELQSGAMSLADIALAIAEGAQGADAVAWQAKLAAADAFTTSLADTTGGQQAYGGDVSDIKAFIAGVTAMGSFSQEEVEALVEATVAEAAAAYHEAIQALFVAYYGRPGDPDGLGFWAQQALASGGDLSSIVQAFGNSEEYTESLGGLGEAEQVGVVFQQLFGRDPDEEGLDFYVGHLEAGNLSLADIALTVASGAQGDDADILAARVSFAESYTSTLNTQARLDEFASPQGQAAVKAALGRVFSDADADAELEALRGEPEVIELDLLESTDETPFLFDAGSASFLFIDDVAEQSHTWIENFSADDTLQLQGVTAEDVRLSVYDQTTHIEFDDGQGTVSQIALVGVAGFFTSVDEFNAADLGDITFA